MNSIRNRGPFCGRCQLNYSLRDIRGPRIPILLSCGHDICRNCVKFMYKNNGHVICDVCQDITKIESENQLLNMPIHYYLVGKIWCFSSRNHLEMINNVSNLKMTDLPGKPVKNIKVICEKCKKCARFYCYQCNESYCENCYVKIHMVNQVMALHEGETVLPDIPQEPRICEQHLKLIDFVCITCQLQMCAVCDIETHQQHDIQTLKGYNMRIEQQISEYTFKGEILLGKLKHYRDEFNVKKQKRQNTNPKKNPNDFDTNKQHLMKYVSSVIGFLQCTERKLLFKFDEAELSVTNSISNIIGQLNSFIEDLQTKLYTAELLLKNKQHSSLILLNTISDIENLLKTTYYISRKNKIETSIKFNCDIFKTVEQCILPQLDISDSYILGYSPEVPPDYILTTTIEVNSDAVHPQRSASLVSSVLTSSCKLLAPSTAKVIDDSLKKFDKSSIKEVIKNEVEPVIVTHLNSPSDFYLQLYANNSVMEMIVDELYKFVTTEQSVVDHIEMNNTTYAVKLSTDQWYRGIVVHIDEKDAKINFTVHCIDYGFIETLTADRIRYVPESISLIPPLAFNCALYKLKPSILTGWSNDAFKLFKDLMSEKSGTFFMYPMEVNRKCIEVDVVCSGPYHPLSIRDAMFFLGYGATEYYADNAFSNRLINSITLPESIKLEEAKEYTITICYFVSPNEFYFQINDKSRILLLEILKMMESIYKPTEINENKGYLLYTPQIGMAVAARYSADGQWYRAKITRLPEPRMVTVFYVDYGNSEILQWDQLRVLDQSLIKEPPLAVKAMIADIHPTVDGKCEKELASLDLLEIKGVIEDKDLIAFVHEVVGDVNKVVLYNDTPQGEFCVNEKNK